MVFVKHREKYQGDKKLCYDCGEYKETSSFNRTSRNNDGLHNYCKPCTHLRNTMRHRKMKPEEYAKKLAAGRRFRANNVKGSMIIHMINGMKQRCRKTGKKYEITRTDVEQVLDHGVCQATGIRFRYERNGRGSITPFSPSLDCVDPEIGYTKENTQIVCSMYNIGKGRHSETDFIAMCMAVAARNWHNETAINRLKELLNGE